MVPIRRLLVRGRARGTAVLRVITRFPLPLSSLTLGRAIGSHPPVGNSNVGMSRRKNGLAVPQVTQVKARGYLAACTPIGNTRSFPAGPSTSFSMEVLGEVEDFVVFREKMEWSVTLRTVPIIS